jgi:hypothetical protein
MKAIELTGSINEQGQLLLDQPIKLEVSGKVRVIVLYTEPTEELEYDFDNNQYFS